jgi:aryl-alcohol dehydrogenase-like predicted oxidoreductase
MNFMIEMRAFGKTDMKVSALGLGGHELNGCTDQQAELLIHHALDKGLNVIDTAECYGQSEERIGKSLGSLRQNCYLFTKCGHASGDLNLPDWSPRLLEQSIERSLRRLRTDYLDLVLLHSCSLEHLQRGEVITILQRAREAGKVRFIGYSGDYEAAHFAASCGAFDALELSVNVADQEAIDLILPLAMVHGLGVIAKRPLANLAWRTNSTSFHEAVDVYKKRLKVLEYAFLQTENADVTDVALRFTLSIPGIHVAVVGTTNPNHLDQNVSALATGLLSQPMLDTIRDRWKAVTWWRTVFPNRRFGWHGWV